jgi:dihydrodipicolinate synthase/N-acetylneuraminate lyase
MEDLRSIYPALPTPMRGNGSVDLGTLKRLVDFVIGEGVDGLSIGGSTAETSLLSEDERRACRSTRVPMAPTRSRRFRRSTSSTPPTK